MDDWIHSHPVFVRFIRAVLCVLFVEVKRPRLEGEESRMSVYRRLASSGQLLTCVLWVTLGAAQADAQPAMDGMSSRFAPRPTEEQFNTALDELKRGNTAAVSSVAAAGSARATPILTQLFATTEDVDMKSAIARAMIDLRNNDAVYPNYLLEQATLAVESDIPSSPPSDGKEFSPEVKAWAEAHHMKAVDAARLAVYGFPGKVFILGDLGLQRAIPILRKALLVRDIQIQAAGAAALAEMNDKESIPLILDACSKAGEGASPIAILSLTRFDDPRAQGGVAQYLSKDLLEALGGTLYLGPMDKRVKPQP